MPRSRYEEMRRDPANWKLGAIYYCPDDPRIVVRRRLRLGWAWNFGHPHALSGIAIAALVVLGPIAIAWWLGVRSELVLMLMGATLTTVVVLAVHRLSRDPGN